MTEHKSISGAVLIVMSVILTASVAFLAWTAQTVYNLHAEISMLKVQTETNTADIRDIKINGSPIMQTVLFRLDALTAGQARIEGAMQAHMKEKHP